jgi:hypothetical protein
MTPLGSALCVMGNSMKESPTRMRVNTHRSMSQTASLRAPRVQPCHHPWSDHSPSWGNSES